MDPSQSFALLKQLWSSIGQVLLAVTWPFWFRSDASAAVEETAPPAVLPADPPSTKPVWENSLAQAVAHLEYLGYEIRHDPDGWTFARHPYRYDFHLLSFDRGIKLHCVVPIGASIGNSRAGWLDYLNTANDRGHLARFTLFEDNRGAYLVRMRGLVTGAYNRSIFSMVMDMWHDDLDIIRRRPEFPRESDGSEDEDVAAEVTVN